ncbi:MAG: hypothetical protein ABSH08_13250 [Tepidisphaeraceae bacterium]
MPRDLAPLDYESPQKPQGRKRFDWELLIFLIVLALVMVMIVGSFFAIRR